MDETGPLVAAALDPSDGLSFDPEARSPSSILALKRAVGDNGSSWHLGAGGLPYSRNKVEDGKPAAAITTDAVKAGAIGRPPSGHTRSSNRS